MIEAPTPADIPAAVLPRGQALRRGLRANPLLLVGALTVLFIVVVATAAPLLAPFPGDAATATHPFAVLRPPSAAHWFGTDQVGRDVLSRVIYGARISPLIAVIVLVIACLVGVPLGIAAGYFGGWVDEVIMRVTDIFLAFPSLLLALALAAVLPPSLTSLTIAIAVTWWPWYTRLIRGQAASVAGLALHRQLPGAGHPALADHRPAYPAQLGYPADRAGIAGRGRGHPDRVGAVVPGSRRPGPHPGLGTDGGRGTELLHHRLVGGHIPWHRHHGHRVRVQPDRRRAA